MTLLYEEVFSTFLTKIVDYSFLEYDEKYIREQMVSWLHTSFANPRLRAKFSGLEMDDEHAKFDFELKVSVSENDDIEFVKDIIARSMVIAWIEPQVKTVLLTKQMFGGKEEKFYAQSNHLSQLQNLLSGAKEELSKILRDYGYLHNLYIKE